jgi:hypothetical protein
MANAHRGRSRLKLSRRQAITVAASAGVGAAAVSVTGLSSASLLPGSGYNGNESIVVHVRDAATGTMDIFIGESRVQVRDADLAASIAEAAQQR